MCQDGGAPFLTRLSVQRGSEAPGEVLRTPGEALRTPGEALGTPGEALGGEDSRAKQRLSSRSYEAASSGQENELRL